MTVEELFRALTAFEPDTPVFFGDTELNLTTSVGLADVGVVIMGFPYRGKLPVLEA